MIRLLRAAADGYARLPGWVRWLALGGWAAVIWIGSSTSGPAGPGSPLRPYLQNGAHVLLYGALGVLWMLAMRGSPRLRLLSAMLLAAAYGALDEWHQSWVPRRTSSAADVLSDVTGALWLGCMLLWLERPSRRLAWTILALAPVAVAAVLLAVHC